jgi:hypothetical protein
MEGEAHLAWARRKNSGARLATGIQERNRFCWPAQGRRGACSWLVLAGRRNSCGSMSQVGAVLKDRFGAGKEDREWLITGRDGGRRTGLRVPGRASTTPSPPPDLEAAK